MSLVCDCSRGETIGNLQRGLGFKYLLLHWDVVCAALPYGGLVIQKLIFNQVLSWKWLRRYVSTDRIWGSGEGKMLMSVSRFDILGSFLFSFLAVGVGSFLRGDQVISRFIGVLWYLRVMVQNTLASSSVGGGGVGLLLTWEMWWLLQNRKGTYFVILLFIVSYVIGRWRS